MLNATLASIVHFISAFIAFGALIYIWSLLKKDLSLTEALNIQWANRVYFVSMLLILIAGLIRVFITEKGAGVYFSTPFFHAKLTCFALIILIAHYPMIKISKWRKDTKVGAAPYLSESQFIWLKRVVTLQIYIFLIVAILASFIAKGYGLR